MKIEILGTESLGVRGLCCTVETDERTFLFDPGAALGYTRHHLLPHPFQVAVDEQVRDKIVQAWAGATDIVISHFHGDHVPLTDANPFQLNAERIAGRTKGKRIWAKLSRLTTLERKRASCLASLLECGMTPAEGESCRQACFSAPVPHGDKRAHTAVMMTRVEDHGVFVHASDIQLLNDEAVEQILAWKADILLLSGPPLYLSGRLTPGQLSSARSRAERLAKSIATVIIDHHLLRERCGIDWLEELRAMTGGNIMCAADYMGRPRMLLEAGRRYLYEKMPVPAGWHEQYARGKADTAGYLKKGLNNSTIAPPR
jgi:predicted metallo-beta-lactamase superfamily hydrolase